MDYYDYQDQLEREEIWRQKKQYIEKENSEYIGKHPNVKIVATPNLKNEKRYVQCPLCGAIIEFRLSDEEHHSCSIEDDNGYRVGVEYWTIKCTNCINQNIDTIVHQDIVTRINSPISCSNAYIPYDELMKRFNIK